MNDIGILIRNLNREIQSGRGEKTVDSDKHFEKRTTDTTWTKVEKIRRLLKSGDKIC